MRLVKEHRDLLTDVMECTPLDYRGRLVLLECVRPPSGGTQAAYFLRLRDVEGDTILATFAEGYGLACALVHEDTIYVFASTAILCADEPGNAWNDVTVFWSRDLQHWDSRTAITHRPGEAMFNSSVCPTPEGFVMACEVTHPDYVSFTIRLAYSANLRDWTPLPDALFAPERYAACPCLRYCDGHYYLLYLEHLEPRRFETWLARSRDLIAWELSPRNPILAADRDEGCNNSDPDLVEFEGKVYLYYATGDQLTWGNLRRCVFAGSLREFYRSAFG
ncbi:MAG: hypothetical protein WCP21_12105 [Armatimonadota bacterium]